MQFSTWHQSVSWWMDWSMDEWLNNEQTEWGKREISGHQWAMVAVAESQSQVVSVDPERHSYLEGTGQAGLASSVKCPWGLSGSTPSPVDQPSGPRGNACQLFPGSLHLAWATSITIYPISLQRPWLSLKDGPWNRRQPAAKLAGADISTLT